MGKVPRAGVGKALMVGSWRTASIMSADARHSDLFECACTKTPQCPGKGRVRRCAPPGGGMGHSLRSTCRRWRLCPAPASAHGAAAPARSGMSVRPVPVSTGLEAAQLGEDGDHMRPIEFEIERTVRAPIEDVFARLIDIDGHNAWMANTGSMLKQTRQTSPGPPAVGTTFVDETSQGSMPGAIVELEAPHTIVYHWWEESKSGKLKFEGWPSYRLQSSGDRRDARSPPRQAGVLRSLALGHADLAPVRPQGTHHHGRRAQGLLRAGVQHPWVTTLGRSTSPLAAEGRISRTRGVRQVRTVVARSATSLRAWTNRWSSRLTCTSTGRSTSRTGQSRSLARMDRS